MSKSNKRVSSSFEQLEQRALFSVAVASPKLMGFLPDYGIQSVPANPIFWEDSSGTVQNDTLNWGDLTQVNYFALLPDATPAYDKATPANTPEKDATSDGGIQALSDSGFDPAAQLPGLVADAHSHGVKVFVTIGAGDPNAIYDMDALMNTPSAFTTFANNLNAFVSQYHLDGVDLDYEPSVDGFTVTKTQLDNFGTLIKTIKTASPNLTLTADPLGDPVDIANDDGSFAGTGLMLNKDAVDNLDVINVQAYPVSTKAESDAIMQNWADYLDGGTDFDGNTVHGDANTLQYGIDIGGDDSSNDADGAIEAKVDTAVTKNYGGLFVFQLIADKTGNDSVIKRIGDEIDRLNGTPETGGSVSGIVKDTHGAGIGGITVYLDADNDRHLDANELRTVTGGNGAYSFSDVPVGAYIVRQQLPVGTTQKSPSDGNGNHITIHEGSALTGRNFVDKVVPTTGSVSGRVRLPNKKGLDGITVYLDANNNLKLDSNERSTVTSGNGNYLFSDVAPGSYIVRQLLNPKDIYQITPAHGGGIHIKVKAGKELTGENFLDETP